MQERKQPAPRTSQPGPPPERLQAALNWLMGPDFWRRVRLVEEEPAPVKPAQQAGD